MHQIFKLLAQGAKFAVSTPAHRKVTMTLARGIGIWYRSLKPHEKRKVNAILKQAAIKLGRLAVGDVVHWAAAEAVAHGLNEYAVQVTEAGVKRISEVGYDRVIAELDES